MRVAELVESLELPPTRVAEDAWQRGRRRVRRRRAAAATLGVGTAAVALVMAGLVPGGSTPTRPEPLAPTPTLDLTPSPAPTGAEPSPLTDALTQRLLLDGGWQDALADVPPLAVDPARTVPLSQRPLDRAVLAIGDPGDESGVLVLGTDGWWRRVDVPGGLRPVHDVNGYTSPVLRSTALSPDDTRLALPQPGGLVVVDLATGTSQRYDVPSLPYYASWLDDTSIYVADELEVTKGAVRLPDGAYRSSAVGAATVVSGGDTLTWDRTTPVLQRASGPDVPTAVANDGGFFSVPPLMGNGIVVGVHAVTSRSAAGEDPPFGAGIVAVSAQDGDTLAYLPVSRGKGTQSELLGWSDGLPLLGLQIDASSSPRRFVVRWDWRHARLEPVVSLATTTVAWGTGRLP